MNIGRAVVQFFFAAALVTCQFWATEARAQSSFFTSRGCSSCHAAPVAATCNGCHYHGASSLRGTTDKASYAPGETVSVTISAGSRSGWVRAILYDQSNTQVAVSNGNASGMGGSATLPTVLSAPAPTTPGTYTWKAAWFGNTANNGSAHGEVTANTNSFTVVAPGDTTVPVVGTFTLPVTATGLTVPVSALAATDNVAVTGYLITTSATRPAATAAGWTAAVPASVTAPGAGSTTFYAWAKDAAGNVSASRSAGVTVTLPETPAPVDTTKPALSISALANGSYTNKVTLNISGSASDAGGIKSVTVNGRAVTVGTGGSFSTALTLEVGANTVAVIATDNTGNQQSDTRTLTYDPSAPVLAVSAPADNSSTVQAFVTVSGTISETSTVTVAVNNGSPQAASISGNGFSAGVYLVPGVNTIDITATDLAGNASSAKRTVTFDGSTNLSLAVTSPAQDVTTRKSSLVLRGKIVDALTDVSVRIKVGGKTYTPAVSRGTFRQRINFTKAGQYVVTVTATDEAGNSSTVTRNVIYGPSRDRDDHDDRDDRDDD